MTSSFPNETAEYRDARNELLRKEQEVGQLLAEVKSLREQLPPGGEIRDYVFERLTASGSVEQVSIVDLFPEGVDTLMVYSMMFGPERDAACPFCTAYLTNLDASVKSLENKAGFVVTVRSPVQRLADWADAKGWQNFTLVSDAPSTFHQDYDGYNPETGDEGSAFNIFVRDGDTIRHYWGSEDLNMPGGDCYYDLIDPAMNLENLVHKRR
ncbi:MAG: DUF899 family protein [Thermomicrobiales bacterium]